MSDSSTQQSSQDDEHWEIYSTYVDEKPAIILVNIGLSKTGPDARMPSLCWIWVHLRNPNADGFPSDDEDDRLNDFEDALTDSIDLAEVRYVGRVTTDGRREFYFYAEDPNKFQESARATLASTADYEIEIDHTDDEAWQHYWDVLYPAPEDFQQIQNEHIINQLLQAGDALTEPRPLDHFANFKSEEDRDAFIASAARLGFEAVSRRFRDDTEVFPYSVGLLRIDAVDHETVDRVTFELWELAQQHQGEYEGWGSTVIKPKS